MRTSPPTTAVSVAVHLGPDDWERSLRADALSGLTADPKVLSPTWLYDERGCELYDEITRLPEYYPTRTERSILVAHALEIASMARADTLVELGSGTAEKTRILLDAMTITGLLRRYVPFDVAEPTLRAAAHEIADEYAIDVEGVVGDFHRHLDRIPRGGRRLIAFLGGTIGNLAPQQRADMLSSLAATMEPGDALLLGSDLVKDRARLVAAYDDRAGVTAAFDKNVLAVLNRELGADFDLDRFAHVARFDEEHEWIEMRLRSLGAQTVHVPALELTLHFADGEELRTEISAKFRPEGVRAELEAAGLVPTGWWTDEAGDFGLSLAMR
jgi:L-histidine N-alpha-methyltransferase